MPMETPPDSSGGTSPTLLVRLRTADPAAWERLVHIYSPLVFGWSRAAGLRSEDAADLMQNVWAAVAIAVPRFDSTSDSTTFRGWLYTITRNKLTDHFRRRSTQPEAEGGSEAYARWSELPDVEPDESHADPQMGLAGVMRRALDLIRTDLEPATFRAFWATAVEGRPPADVAAELGVTVAVVYQSKSRVLRRLRVELDGLTKIETNINLASSPH